MRCRLENQYSSNIPRILNLSSQCDPIHIYPVNVTQTKENVEITSGDVDKHDSSSVHNDSVVIRSHLSDAKDLLLQERHRINRELREQLLCKLSFYFLILLKYDLFFFCLNIKSIGCIFLFSHNAKTR